MKKTKRKLIMFDDARQTQALLRTWSPGSADCRSAGRLGVSQLLHIAIQLACLLVAIMFVPTTAKALPPNPPPGPYHQNCRDSKVVGTDLVATCVDFFGNYRTTHLNNYAACTGPFTDANGARHQRNIFNIDGSLRCVIALKKRPNNDRHDPGSLFDVISITKQENKGSQEGRVWRIDRPQVWANRIDGEVDYPMITFQPGDHLLFAAGGCVQTGGAGQTWKKYLDPHGPNAERFYSGTVELPGLTRGYSELSAIVKQGAQVIPGPHPGSDPSKLPKNFLRLGYKDNQLDDNGYYSHDDGTDGQCKNEGPAWVQVTVITGIPVVGPQLSPHSKAFDLVWDINNDEDENLLPMNPQWNYALNHWDKKLGKGAQPHFIPICGAAFSSPSPAVYNFDRNLFAQICSSMSPDFDEVFRGGAICHGHPIPGHLNFGIATYFGSISWEGFGNTDDDWEFTLWRPDDAGLAGLDEGPAPDTHLHMEFDAREIPLPITPFWKDLVQAVPGIPFPNASVRSWFPGPNGEGPEGVVIGEIGLDGVHGATAEIHPVFAMAVRAQHFISPEHPDEMVEKWAFFLRNFGNEGFCSNTEWYWPDQPKYFIPLPWPENATELLAHSPDVVRWQDAPTPIGIEVNKVQRFSLISVGKPAGVDQFGAGGTFELVYKVTGPPKRKRTAAARTSTPAPREPKRVETNEIEREGLSTMIADPAIKARFEADVKALPPMTTTRLTKAIHVDVPKTITERKHVPGAPSKGILTRARPVPNLAKRKWDSELLNILQTYQKDLKIESPATPPPSLSPLATPTPPK